MTQMFKGVSGKHMQDDINKVVAWNNTWLMRLNVSKCKVMHLGKRNSQHNNIMSSNYGGKLPILIVQTKEKRDLGVLILKNLRDKLIKHLV